MAAFLAFEFEPGDDIATFSRVLWQEGVPHRVLVHEGRTLLLVGQPVHAARARETLERVRAGDAVAHGAGRQGLGHALQRAARQFPITLLLVALSVLGGLVVEFDTGNVLLHWLSFTDFREEGGRLLVESAGATFARHEYWRLVTPLFLHFGALHLVFNALWTWELGRRIEYGRGGVVLLSLTLVTGVGGNLAQDAAQSGVLFGGMSGVIYGMLGYMWMWNRFARQVPLALPPGILGFMLGWLAICASGLVEALGFGAIANAAHIGGLLLGMALGLLAALFNRGDFEPG